MFCTFGSRTFAGMGRFHKHGYLDGLSETNGLATTSLA
jgi:hypothetical protein